VEGIIVINGLRNIFSVSMFFYLTVIAHNCKMAIRAYGGRSSVFWAYGFLMYKLLHRLCENGRLTRRKPLRPATRFGSCGRARHSRLSRRFRRGFGEV